ncbi:hypothetical protein [Paraburkholderia sp. J8-2]|uniref:Mom family adenine methylcarbamoylation protein n=1 Tax=Paraburkholderia sp. J8-2 TaxID=2805440 RepID=UPI002AB68114|nr:hypothetical protein [Paraburkholderia sp. J8-2]
MSQEIMTTATCPAQRWKYGRQYWRTYIDRDEGFRKADYAVDIITDREARKFVVDNHYSHSYPAAVERVGFFKGTELVGVAVFSVPMNNAAIPKYSGLTANEGLELGRFLLVDTVPYCGESSLSQSAFKLLRQVRPSVKAVIAYADPMPRTTEHGETVMPGHLGTAYTAANARYVGRSAARTLHLTRDGIVLSPRSISKIRLQEQGADGAERNLVRLGAPSRAFGEDPAEWVARVLASNIFIRVRHPGNHTFCWALGRPNEKRRLEKSFAPAKPYPKQLDPVQHGLELLVTR